MSNKIDIRGCMFQTRNVYNVMVQNEEPTVINRLVIYDRQSKIQFYIDVLQNEKQYEIQDLVLFHDFEG